MEQQLQVIFMIISTLLLISFCITLFFWGRDNGKKIGQSQLPTMFEVLKPGQAYRLLFQTESPYGLWCVATAVEIGGKECIIGFKCDGTITLLPIPARFTIDSEGRFIDITK